MLLLFWSLIVLYGHIALPESTESRNAHKGVACVAIIIMNNPKWRVTNIVKIIQKPQAKQQSTEAKTTWAVV